MRQSVQILLLCVIPCVAMATYWAGSASGAHGSRQKQVVGDRPGGSVALVERSRQVDRIISLLDGIPDWPMLPVVDDGHKTPRVLEQSIALEMGMREIAQYDLDSIREAVKQYRDLGRSGSRVRASEKLFFLNTYLFALPRTLPRESVHFVHFLVGWQGMPITGDPRNPQPSDKASVRWPWEADERGRYHFVLDRKLVLYLGPPYPALERFDYYRKNFGPRQPVRE